MGWERSGPSVRVREKQNKLMQVIQIIMWSGENTIGIRENGITCREVDDDDDHDDDDAIASAFYLCSPLPVEGSRE